MSIEILSSRFLSMKQTSSHLPAVSGNVCQSCLLIFDTKSKPSQCKKCSKFFHKTKCLREHNKVCLATTPTPTPIVSAPAPASLVSSSISREATSVPSTTSVRALPPASTPPTARHPFPQPRPATSQPITLNGMKVDFVDCAEHVGLARSTLGNSVPLFTRISAHKKALGAVLHSGMARGHRGNPAASLRVVQLYGAPVLLSGIAALVLSKPDETIIDHHYKDIIMNIQKLLPGTPRAVIFFLAGTLPGTALLHLRQLSIFGMICRLSNNVIHQHAVNIMSSATISPKSWFLMIRNICLQYLLPHPLSLLQYPPSQDAFKNLVKKHVVDYWERLLRAEAEPLTSLCFFKPQFMSLSKPHPIWHTAGSSPSKISMAVSQALMVSGRYRCEKLCSNWSQNKAGVCLISKECVSQEKDIPHILRFCSGLDSTREKLKKFTHRYCMTAPPIIRDLATNLCSTSSPFFCQFLLDCSVLPSVITATQREAEGEDILGHLFHLSRTWVFNLHRERLRLLGRWNMI